MKDEDIYMNYKLTCPLCGWETTLYNFPQSIEYMKNNDILGRCYNCHESFRMADEIKAIN